MEKQEIHSPIQIPEKMYFSIAEVAEITGVKAHVLRYWESLFSIIHPDKSKANRRMYSRSDVEAVILIKDLLYGKKFSIEGAKKHVNELKRAGDLKKALVPKVQINEDQLEKLRTARALLLDLVSSIY